MCFLKGTRTANQINIFLPLKCNRTYLLFSTSNKTLSLPARMSADDLSKLFDIVELCSVNPDTLVEGNHLASPTSPASASTWTISEHEGRWVPGSSAGGSRRYRSACSNVARAALVSYRTEWPHGDLSFFSLKSLSGRTLSSSWASRSRTTRMTMMKTTRTMMMMTPTTERATPRVKRRKRGRRKRRRGQSSARCWWSCCRRTAGRRAKSTSCTSPSTSTRCRLHCCIFSAVAIIITHSHHCSLFSSVVTDFSRGNHPPQLWFSITLLLKVDLQ